MHNFLIFLCIPELFALKFTTFQGDHNIAFTLGGGGHRFFPPD